MTEGEKLIKSLSKVGIYINDVYDLVNDKQPYPKAIPVLIEYLKNDLKDDKLKEGIIRSLAVSEAKGIANKTLLDEFTKVPKDKMLLRWAIGNSICDLIQPVDVKQVIDIVRNADNGMVRQMFIMALGTARTELAEQTLIELLSDDEVAPHCMSALGKMKSIRSIGQVRMLVGHSNPLIRKEAIKALAKIERA